MNVSNSLAPEAIKRQIEKEKTQSNANESEQSDNVFDRALEIKEKSTTIYELSNEISIHSREDLMGVIEILKGVKEHREKIISYWKTSKDSAKNAYKEIAYKEKEMLNVCDKIEENLKNEILIYKNIQEANASKLSNQAKEYQKQEAQKLLDEAIEAQENGNEETANSKFRQAEMIENLEKYTAKVFQKSDGITTQKRWKCRITDNKSVPAFFGETEIREVNTKKLLEIRKLNPNVKIPGVEFCQIESVLIKT